MRRPPYSKGNNVDQLIALARQYIGLPYRWGGSSPTTGFDCSGFVMWLYARQGVHLPRTTYDQFRAGTPIPKAALRPGDIVFFEPSKRGPGHEGLYIGHGMFIESPHTGSSIRISSLADRRDYVGARRVIPGGAHALAELTGAAQGPSNSPHGAAATASPRKPKIPVPRDENQVGGLRMPSAALAANAPEFMSKQRQLADSWQLIAGQSNVSPETKRYALNAATAAGMVGGSAGSLGITGPHSFFQDWFYQRPYNPNERGYQQQYGVQYAGPVIPGAPTITPVPGQVPLGA